MLTPHICEPLTSLTLERVSPTSIKQADSCNTVGAGYQCQPQISHYWGQYSPYFRVPSDISSDVPPDCSISFAQILSRHGARYPTALKTASYYYTITQIQERVQSYTGKYVFLANYTYSLGADDLTTFGENEMFDSGIKFYNRYAKLGAHSVPFIRSASGDRVVVSAQEFARGFALGKQSDPSSDKDGEYPSIGVILCEARYSNNTLNHGLCTEFETGVDDEIADNAQKIWASIFGPPIQARVNADLPGANLSVLSVINLMDLCPFDTVNSDTGSPLSAFCALFTEDEWHSYDYSQSLGKFYGYGAGNPLGPTQGVGFTNELIARLTGKPVEDHTSVNHTLDDSMVTFPLDATLYADFSHDNDMTAIFSAMGLYNATTPLSNTSIETSRQTHGYSASWTVPFGARAYIEKMVCQGQDEELVRVLVNDRVIPLQNCRADRLGRCRLGAFVESLSFAREGGLWGQCFG